MKRLTTLLLTLAACGNEGDSILGDDVAPTSAVGEFRVIYNENDGGNVAAAFDESAENVEFMDEIWARIFAIAEGTCGLVPQYPLGPEVAFQSVGNLQLGPAESPVLDLSINASRFYAAQLAVGTFGTAASLDLRSTGGDLPAIAAVGAIQVPPAPVLIGTRDASDLFELGPTLTYEPSTATILQIRTTVDGPNGFATYACSLDPAAGSFTFPDGALAMFAEEGALEIHATYAARVPLAPGDDRGVLVQVDRTANDYYAKTP